MIKRSIFLTVLLALTLASCSQHSGHDNEAIVLDKGAKWKVHDNMMVHIEKMATDVKTTEGLANTDYKELSTGLLSGIDNLTSDCTMTGKAHDELHKWLLPYIGTVNEYTTDMSDDQKAAWLDEVRESMKEFEKFFE